jgi:hypothetical protein
MSNKTILQNNNASLEQHNLSLQELVEMAESLPDADIPELPELTNEGVADDLVLGKELIDSNGRVVTGTNPYEKTSTDEAVNL